jgi:DNA segregation ATPase FtsK/SpoIIIE, S-DNA-T family
MAPRRRSTPRSSPGNRGSTRSRRSSRAAPKPGGALPRPSLSLGVSPAVLRSLVGIVLLMLGAVSLIALALPGGSLTDWWRDLTVPYFGAARFLFPLVLLLAGWYVEWGPGREPGAPWGRTLLGITLAYAAFLGLIQIVNFRGEFTGGRIGRFLETLLAPLLTTPGAFIILIGLLITGILVAFDMPLRAFLAPLLHGARAAGSTLQDRTAKLPEVDGAPNGRAPDGRSSGAAGAAGVTAAEIGRRGRSPRIPAVDAPGQTGAWGTDALGPGIPSGVPSQTPTSATFAPQRNGGGGTAVAPALAVGAPGAAERGQEGVASASAPPPTRVAIDWVLPPHDLLDPGEVPTPAATGNADLVHARNEGIIVRKLASFDIEARIIGRNAGPVVTQYEVQPAPHIKLSRIEALQDDLSMALAARSIRIEAPIPGKSAVGIEIPNAEFNVVALRRILEELDFAASGTRLTFALGRDVAGRAQAVDLAKMPHLLIAGATGSGKSVMVNALITSLLCNATPDDVRMILMDLKRVELAGYNGLPHLLVPVITEPERAKAALKWAVAEMETRYRKFAGATARNVKAFNETRVDPADRLPYIVIVIDELADLMMREGKNVEDPIVRLAQKARATGIHMVLATQRPSVNVVTGLIKANFPSRIAFAMASQIDSRTILDSPGAEDLIGRGDMLYQPSDLPRPMRLQGVFVSDPEIGRVTQFWRDQIDDPRYDLSIINNDEESTGSVEELADDDADRLLMDAVSVIREYDRASASLLQRRLRIGYARAARIIDQLEARGYVGAFDGSNARVVLRRDDGPAAGADEDEA